MNRMWRFLRTALWLAVVIAVVAIGAVGIRGFGHEEATKAHGQQQQFAERGQGDKYGTWQQQQGFGQGNENSHFAGQTSNRDGHGERGHRGFEGGGLISLLGSLVLLVAGWALWKRAGRTGRWIGGLLIAVVLLPLVIPAAVLYLIWRVLRRPARSSEPLYVATTESHPSSAVDALDVWEAKTRRELKNKEDK